MVGTNTVVKWVIAGAVAAATVAMSSMLNLGNDLVTALVLIAIGVAIFIFLGPKKLGAASSIPAGFVVAGGIMLSNKYIVPRLPASSVNGGSV